MKINNIPNNTRDIKETYTTIKADIVKAAGYDPELLPPEAYEVSLGELRGLLAHLAWEDAGFDSIELTLLTKGRVDLGEAQFKGILRRAKSGVRALPRAFLKAHADGKLLRFGALPNAFRMALGELDKVGSTDLKGRIEAGYHVLFLSEGQLKKVLRTWERAGHPAESLLDAAFTPERIILEVVRETGFTPDKLAALLPKATVKGPVVTAKFGYAEIDFHFETGHIGEHKVLKRVVSMGRKLDTATVIGLFALSLDGVTTQSTAEAKLKAAAPSIFEEPNTGYGLRIENSRHEEVIKNKIGILNIKARAEGTSLTLSDRREFTDVVEAARLYWNAGEPVAFEQQIGWAVAGDGALALGFGRDGDFATIFSDAGKTSKVHSRGKLGAKAAAETVDEHGNSTVVASGFQIKLSDGRLVRSHGTRIHTWFTNFVLGSGSGVALVRPGFTRKVRIMKTVAATIPAIYLTVEDNPTMTRADLLKQAVEAKLSVNRNEVIHYEDVVFDVDGIPYGVWDGRGLTCQVVGEPSITVSASSDSVKVSVKVAAAFEFDAHKFNTDGVKATGISYDVALFDLDANEPLFEQPEMLLTTQEIKGVGTALVRAWADDVQLDLDKALFEGWLTPADHAQGGVVYDPNTGLSEEQQTAFAAWRDGHSRNIEATIEVDEETYTIVHELLERAKIDSEFAEEKGIDPGKFTLWSDRRTISQVIEVVEAQVVMGIELSTVPENVTTQPLIGEQLVALKHLDTELGNTLWKGAANTRLAVRSMLSMARGHQAPIAVQVGPILEFDKDKYRGRDLLERFRKRFPQGLTLTNVVGHPLVTLRFDALCELGALMPGGAATGIALSVLELLHHMHVDRAGQRGWESHLLRLVGIVREGAVAWATKAKASLGTVTKTRKVALGLKVKTTFSRNLASDEVGFNPMDPLVLEGKVKSGSYALVGRPPMISVFGGKVVLTSECPIGMVLVKAHLWSLGNEGDGDGDPAVVLFLKNPNMIDRVKAALANSPFGVSGYFTAHGNEITDLPYSEFYAESTKKRVHGATHEVARIPGVDYLAGAEQCGQHYSRFLGRTFAITSYLTYLLGTQLEASAVDPALETACVLAWRRLYEGMGLSGVSEKAQKFAMYIGQIGKADRISLPMATAQELEWLGFQVTYNNSPDGRRAYVVGVDAMRYAWSQVSSLPVDGDVLAYLHRAVLVTHAYSLIEREAIESEYMSVTPIEVLAEVGPHLTAPGILQEAVTYGVLRRGSKGLGVAAAMGEEDGNGLFRHLTDEWIMATGHGIVSDMLTAVRDVQTEMAAIRRANSDI